MMMMMLVMSVMKLVVEAKKFYWKEQQVEWKGICVQKKCFIFAYLPHHHIPRRGQPWPCWNEENAWSWVDVHCEVWLCLWLLQVNYDVIILGLVLLDEASGTQILMLMCDDNVGETGGNGNDTFMEICWNLLIIVGIVIAYNESGP